MLKTKIAIIPLFFLLVLSLLPISSFASYTLTQYYNANDDNEHGFKVGIWDAQTFTTSTAYSITSVKLKLYKEGSPKTITVSIRLADVNNKPSGNDLTDGTTDGDTLPTGSPYEWREITLTPYVLSASTQYAIVVRCVGGTGANFAHWREDATSPTYSGGSCVRSTDTGVTWTVTTTVDYMFECYGTYSYTKSGSKGLVFSVAVGRFFEASRGTALNLTFSDSSLAWTNFIRGVTQAFNLQNKYVIVALDVVRTLTTSLGVTNSANRGLDILRGTDVNIGLTSLASLFKGWDYTLIQLLGIRSNVETPEINALSYADMMSLNIFLLFMAIDVFVIILTVIGLVFRFPLVCLFGLLISLGVLIYNIAYLGSDMFFVMFTIIAILISAIGLIYGMVSEID